MKKKTKNDRLMMITRSDHMDWISSGSDVVTDKS